MSVIVATIRVVHYAASTFLVGSSGFMVASVMAFNAQFRPWADGLATTYLWNFALAVALYALVAVLLVGQGVVRLATSQRRGQL